jgi:signal transduction histidine kinase
MGKTQIIITIILFNLFFILFIVGILIFIQQYRLKKKEHNAMITNQNKEHQKELLSTQIEIQRQTMQHIGREIHDNIGQKLTLASLYTQQLAFENKAPEIKENIDQVSQIINQSLSELRELSKSLTDVEVEKNTLNKLINDEVKKVNKLKVCLVSFVDNAKQLELDYQKKMVLYRIVQEFLQNSIKHSGCKHIMITLKEQSNGFQLLIADDGKGFDVSQKFNGIGLSNMKKRATLVGGEFNFESSSKGTNLKIIFLTL